MHRPALKTLALFFFMMLVSAPAARAMQNEPYGFGNARWNTPVRGYKWLVPTGCSVGEIGEDGSQRDFFPQTPMNRVRCYRVRGVDQRIAGQPLEKVVYMALNGRLFAVRGAFRYGANFETVKRAFLGRFGKPDSPASDPSGLLKQHPGSLMWIGSKVWVGLTRHPGGWPEFFMFFSPTLKQIQ